MILALWAGSLAWLAGRMARRGGRTFVSGPVTALPPEAYFYIVRAAGRQVGVASISVDTVPEGVRVTERLGLDLPGRGETSRNQFTREYVLDPNLRLLSYRLTTPAPQRPATLEAERTSDTTFRVLSRYQEVSDSWTVVTRFEIPAPLDPVLFARDGKLHQGQDETLLVYDPVAMRSRPVQLITLSDSILFVPDSAVYDSTAGLWVTASVDTVPVWSVGRAEDGELTGLLVNARGFAMTSQQGGGLGLERSAFEIVSLNYRKRLAAQGPGWSSSIVPRTALADGARVPTAVVRERRLRLIHPATWPGRGSAVRDGARQRAYNGDLIVSADSLPAPHDTLTADDRTRWLRDEPQLEITDSVIEARARAIAGNDTDPRRIAEKLTRWVASNIRPEPVYNPIRARTVLRLGRGDVDEHTLLLVALARSLGIPARAVSGLLLTPGRYYFHSWVELYLDGWVPVDPTAGQFPADAARVRFAVDALARPPHLFDRLAGIRLTVIEDSKH